MKVTLYPIYPVESHFLTDASAGGTGWLRWMVYVVPAPVTGEGEPARSADGGIAA